MLWRTQLITSGRVASLAGFGALPLGKAESQMHGSEGNEA
jgi:hypothetical protein